VSNSSDGELPSDPFGSHDAERVTKEVGGQILGRIERVGGAGLLTIGFLSGPLSSLNQVGIRMYRDGEAAAAINLTPDEAYEVANWIRAAAGMCIGPLSHDPLPEPRTNWDEQPIGEGKDED
jgi:hypothetical protein